MTPWIWVITGNLVNQAFLSCGVGRFLFFGTCSEVTWTQRVLGKGKIRIRPWMPGEMKWGMLGVLMPVSAGHWWMEVSRLLQPPPIHPAMLWHLLVMASALGEKSNLTPADRNICLRRACVTPTLQARLHCRGWKDGGGGAFCRLATQTFSRGSSHLACCCRQQLTHSFFLENCQRVRQSSCDF